MNLSTVVDGLRRNWSDPYWYADVFNMFVPPYYYREVVGNDGEYVLDRDWDSLFILDGCRYDTFADVYGSEYGDRMGGTLENVTSRGSASTEFIDENYRGRTLADTVYVTANPFVYDLPADTFHHVDHVWMNDWDDELETVRAETMVEHAIDAHEQYPNKRLIVHFMQPHYPFVGETRLEGDRGYVDAIAKSRGEQTDDVTLVWERLRRGEVDEASVRAAYRDNLRYVLDEVEELTTAIGGKHVVTADHGNALGERSGPFPTRVYGHDDYVHIPALVEVPWLTLAGEKRRTITSGESASEDATSGETARQGTTSDATDEEIEERLEALGYR